MIPGLLRLLTLLLVALCLSLPTDAPAQDQRLALEMTPAVQTASDRLDAAEQRLQDLQGEIEDNATNDARLVELKLALEEMARHMIEIGVSLRPRLSEIKARIDALGPPPGEGEPPELPAVKAERERLSQERALINSLTGQAETISIRANQLGDSITERRRELFTDTLLNRTPIDAAFFNEAGSALVAERRSFDRIIGSWLHFVWTFKFQALMASLFLSALAGLFVAVASRRIFGRAIERDPTVEHPGYLRRLATAFWSAVIPTGALAVGLVAVIALMVSFAVLRPDITRLLGGVFAALILITFNSRVAHAILAPANPNWRLLSFSNRGARWVYYLIVLMTVVYAVDFVLGNISKTLGSPLVVTVAKGFFATIILGLLLVAMSRVRPILATSGDPADPGRPWPGVVKIFFTLSGLAMVLLSLGGYVGLSKFISEQILLSGAILALMYVGYLSGQEVMEPGNFARTRPGRAVTRSFSPSPTTLDQMGLGVGLLIDALVLIIGIPLILLQWGFQVADIELWVYRAFTDIRVGGLSISLTGILVGILLFLLAVFGMRYFQRWLDRNVMARSRMDPGVRNSINTGIGYLGVALALLIGVLAAGINLSSLAIVAGALSLGIGFGLQNIVSNFVSGLILLAERPFKVGDWVETGTTQGFVKRISVRATEIETFQMQTIIVPNSEFINGRVGNWNHRNSVARADVAVGVSYDADPETVMRILEEVALAHELVLRNPAPAIHFVNFGASSLDFELKVFIADVLTGMGVKNDLRIAIYKRFREEGIEIPFPQSDINFSVKHVPAEIAQRVIGGAGESGGSGNAAPRAKRRIQRDEPDGPEEDDPEN